MTPTLIPVFLNGRSATVAPGSTLGALVAQVDPELARAFEAGRAKATDARGIPAAADAVLAAGAIYRVFPSARAESDPGDA